MADVKISAAASAGTLLSTDMVPVARSGDTSAYHGTMTQLATFIASVSGGVTSFNTRTGAVTLTSADVTSALTYTPYNTTNPANYITAAGAPVQSVATRTGTVTLTHTDITDWTATLAPYALTTSVPAASSTVPLIEGTAAIGTGTTWARADHVHPAAGGGASITVSDTAPGSPTSGALWWDSVGGQLYLWYVDANSSQWVVANSGGALVPGASTTTPSMDGTAAVGTGTTYARADHIHPSDTSRAPLASPTFTGTPTLPTGTIAVTQAAGNSTTAPSTTAFVQAAVAPAFNDVGRNLLHNPIYNVTQRGAGPWTAGGYTADRWSVAVNLDTLAVNLVAVTDAHRSAIGDESANTESVISVTGNAGAAAVSVMQQRIESVRRLAGKTVTVSFCAWCDSGALKLGVSLDQVFGTGGSPSAQVSGNGQSVTLQSPLPTAARYQVTFSVPSISGKTLGTGANDYTQLNLWFSGGTNYTSSTGAIGVQTGTFRIWGVQLEIGSVATPLEKPDPQQDLAKCQRFYQAISGVQINTSVPAGTVFGQTVVLPVKMRAVPTVAFNGQTYGNASGVTLGGNTVDAVTIYASMTATGGGYFLTNFTASADL